MWFLIVALASFIAVAHARVVEYNFTVGWHIVKPDGVEKRMNLVNGQFPGPEVRAKVGDTVRVNMHNALGHNSTAIHFHGINQKRTPFSDGVPGITQWDTKPGDNYTYEFTPDESGSAFWHSHSKIQYPLGLIGPLVIEEDEHDRVWDYDDEHTVVLTDHFDTSEWELLARILQPGVGDPKIDSLLICSTPGSCNYNRTQHFNFESGKTYRLRIINMSATSYFRFSVDEHDLQIIQTDFGKTNGSYAQWVPLAPAQRIEALLHTKKDQTDNVWIRSVSMTKCMGGLKDGVSEEVKAVGVFGKKHQQPKSNAHKFTSKEDCYMLEPHQYAPYNHSPAHRHPVQVTRLAGTLAMNKQHIATGYINNQTYDVQPQMTPTLFELMKGKNASELSADRNAYVLHKRGPVHIYFDGIQDGDPHPYHMHGHTFKVLGIVPSPFDPKNTTGLNFDKPAHMDTILVPGKHTAVLEIEVDNPGAWMVHCHMDWHLNRGFAAQLVELPDEFYSKYGNKHTDKN